MRPAHRHLGLQPGAAKHSRGCLLGTCLLMMLIFSASSSEQNAKPTEFAVKAAYLFNFGKFVKWPEPIGSDYDTFSICVLGSDPFGRVLDFTVAGESIDGRKVSVRRMSTAADAAGCRILFVGRSEVGRLGPLFATLGRSPVLTVSDIDGFTDREGMIQFVMDHDRVRFEVNLPATQRAGLSLSSELLKVATSVKGHAGD
jgi:hypothetical protein